MDQGGRGNWQGRGGRGAGRGRRDTSPTGPQQSRPIEYSNHIYSNQEGRIFSPEFAAMMFEPEEEVTSETCVWPEQVCETPGGVPSMWFAPGYGPGIPHSCGAQQALPPPPTLSPDGQPPLPARINKTTSTTSNAESVPHKHLLKEASNEAGLESPLNDSIAAFIFLLRYEKVPNGNSPNKIVRWINNKRIKSSNVNSAVTTMRNLYQGDRTKFLKIFGKYGVKEEMVPGQWKGSTSTVGRAKSPTPAAGRTRSSTPPADGQESKRRNQSPGKR